MPQDQPHHAACKTPVWLAAALVSHLAPGLAEARGGRRPQAAVPGPAVVEEVPPRQRGRPASSVLPAVPVSVCGSPLGVSLEVLLRVAIQGQAQLWWFSSLSWVQRPLLQLVPFACEGGPLVPNLTVVSVP